MRNLRQRPRFPKTELLEHDIEYRCQEESENGHADHTGKYRNTHRLAHFGTRAAGFHQREYTRDKSD